MEPTNQIMYGDGKGGASCLHNNLPYSASKPPQDNEKILGMLQRNLDIGYDDGIVQVLKNKQKTN